MELVSVIITELNSIMVKGQDNLALLYNAIEHLKQLQKLLDEQSKKTEVQTVYVNEDPSE